MSIKNLLAEKSDWLGGKNDRELFNLAFYNLNNEDFPALPKLFKKTLIKCLLKFELNQLKQNKGNLFEFIIFL